ncbi:MAG: TPM domain-containing protein, partial [Betaproteobacteria bacterium]|nr:TPM domain-containing protein [Betaproteobacteria bacterium]
MKLVIPAPRRARDEQGFALAGIQVFARTCVAIFALCVSLFASHAYAAEGDPIPVPPLKQRVTDQTASLSAADEARIEGKLRAFESAKGSQIAVLIVPTTQPEAIFDFAFRVGEAWKLGRKGMDDG